MCVSRQFICGLLSTLVGVVAGGLISLYASLTVLERQLDFEKKRAGSGFQLDIARIRYSLYLEFFDKYGDISQVNDKRTMSDKAWWELNELLAKLNVIGDEEVAKSVVEFYVAVGKVRGNMGSDNVANRTIYFEARNKIVKSMTNSLGIKKVEAHWADT